MMFVAMTVVRETLRRQSSELSSELYGLADDPLSWESDRFEDIAHRIRALSNLADLLSGPETINLTHEVLH